MIGKPISRIIGIAGLVIIGSYIYYSVNTPRVFEVRGRVAGFATDRKSVFVSHEDIPGYMKAMTMPFSVRDTSELTSLKVGDPVGFTLHVTPNEAWITDVHNIPDSLVHINSDENNMLRDAAAAGNSELLHIGDLLPGAILKNQDGKKINTHDFQNKVLVLTFIYTRCPLPNYCPLMSANFRNAEKTLIKAYGDKVHLLSISFDTQKDTPEVLKTYGRKYGAQFKYWSFASGTKDEIGKLTSAFGVFYQPSKGFFTHNLCTVVIGPDGRIRKIFNGNQWTVEDLLREIASVFTAS